MELVPRKSFVRVPLNTLFLTFYCYYLLNFQICSLGSTSLLLSSLIFSLSLSSFFPGLYLCAAVNVSKIKRKQKVDEASLLGNKVLTVADDFSKQAASKRVVAQKKKSDKSRKLNISIISDGCARSSINGWEWRRWTLKASPAERARNRGFQYFYSDPIGPDVSTSHLLNGKGLSARTNRVKLRNLLAAADGADLLKASQLKVVKN